MYKTRTKITLTMSVNNALLRAAQHNQVWHSVVRCGLAQPGVAQYGLVWLGTARCSTAWPIVTLHSQVWHSMARCGSAQPGVVQRGPV